MNPLPKTGGGAIRPSENRMTWLRSPTANKAHLVFLTCLGLLGLAVLNGNQRPLPNDWLAALVFCSLAYPVVLFLIWVKWRINRGSEI